MHILIVDDDQDVCRILSHMLQRRGYTTDVLHSGFGVTNKVAGRGGNTQRPDLVVLDYMMPGLSADKVLPMLAADATTRDVPVLLYSAADMSTLEALAKTHPRCTPVQKGLGTRNVVAMIEQVLGTAPS